MINSRLSVDHGAAPYVLLAYHPAYVAVCWLSGYLFTKTILLTCFTYVPDLAMCKAVLKSFNSTARLRLRTKRAEAAHADCCVAPPGSVGAVATGRADVHRACDSSLDATTRLCRLDALALHSNASHRRHTAGRSPHTGP